MILKRVWGGLEAVVPDADTGRLRLWRRRTRRPDLPWQPGELVQGQPGGQGPPGPGAERVSPSPEPASPTLESAAARPAQRAGPAARPELDAPATLGRRRLVAVGECVYEERLVRGEWLRVACLRLRDAEPFVADERQSVVLAQVSGQATAAGGPTLSLSEETAGVRGTDLGVRVEHAGRSFLLCGDTHWARRPWLATRDSLAEVFDDGAGLPKVVFHGSPLKLVGRGVTMREYDVPLDGFSAGGQFWAFFTSNHFRNGRVMGRSVLAVAEDPCLPVDPAARRRPLRFRALGTFSQRHFVNVSVQARGEWLYVWGSGAYRASDLYLARLPLAAFEEAARAGPPGRAGPDRPSLTPVCLADLPGAPLAARSSAARLSPPGKSPPMEAGAAPPVEPNCGQSDVAMEDQPHSAGSDGALADASLTHSPFDPQPHSVGSGGALAGPFGRPEASLRAAALGRAVLGSVEYWAGAGRWTSNERRAAPIIAPGAFGEISVRWVDALDSYVLLYAQGAGEAIGPSVVMRTAPDPWGPWSPRRRLLDWSRGVRTADGRHLMRHSDADQARDHVFRAQAGQMGAAYAPYLFDAARAQDEIVLRYTLSTWNPYQIMLMQHRLLMEDGLPT